MNTLHEIYHASYDYDGDVRIIPASVSSFEMWVYSSRHNWKKVEATLWPLSSEQVNNLLNKRYRLHNTDPFSGTWEYRITRPEWDELKDWLYVWYAEQECKAMGDVRRAYLEIWAHLYEKCTLQEALQWANERKGWYRDDQKLAGVYSELVDILNSYDEENHEHHA